MGVMDYILKRAKKNPKKIVFPEGDDFRIKKACKIIFDRGIASPIILKSGSIKKRLTQGLSILKNNGAEGLITGATHSTVDTIRLALNFRSGWVSGAFLMLKKDKIFLFADCAVIPNPDYEQLSKIAIDSAKTFERLTNKKARVAMLSFSTKGSARDESVNKVIKATRLVKKKKIIVGGELQADAALVRGIAEKKGSKVINGDANVLIFPNLDAGNIGYKLVQRLAGYEAIGPILQGLKKPINDLSRGCSVEDVVNLTAVTCLE